MPRDPINEKGANEARFLSQHRGRRISDVIPKSAVVRVVTNPAVSARALPVSAKIMLYAKTAPNVLNVADTAGIQDVSSPTDLDQASGYDLPPV